MSEPFLGEIMLVGFPFAPRYWATCSGQILNNNQNLALFSLLGNTYGGGTNTFALPTLNAAIPVGVSADASFPIVLGQTGGQPSVTLVPAQLPNHTHTLGATDSVGNTPSCSSAYLAGLDSAYALPVAGAMTTLTPASVSTVGQGAAHDNRQPFLGMTFIIALAGVFPSKN